MKPVYQTKFGESDGNCFQAAVASLFDLPLDDVPDFMERRSLWWDRFCEWSRVHYDLEPLCIEIRKDYWFTPAGLYLLSGKSPRGNYQHQCIALNGEIVHDPHPSGDGLADAQEIILFTKYFPAERDE